MPNQLMSHWSGQTQQLLSVQFVVSSIFTLLYNRSLELFHVVKLQLHPLNTNSQPTRRMHLKYPTWVIMEAVPLDPTRHLLHYNTLPRQEDRAALPNT